MATVFKRQLSVPLFGIKDTYKEYQEWAASLPEGLIDTKSVEWSYNKAVKLLKVYEPMEEKLLSAESVELGEIYREYIKIADKDPSTVVCLYERALVDLCLSPDIWDDYCRFVSNLGDMVVKISSRAVRNCPWSENLWVNRLRYLEKLEKEETNILECFEQGIQPETFLLLLRITLYLFLGLTSTSPSPGLDLWLTYLEYICRNSKDTNKIDKLFIKGIEQLGFENDPSSKLTRWHARLLAKRGDIGSAKKKWNSIMSHEANRSKMINHF